MNDTINLNGNEYEIGENSVYEDSNGDRHPIHFISRPEGCLVRVGKDNAIVIIRPTTDDSPWCVAHIGGAALYFTDPDEVEVFVNRWIDDAFDALPE